MNVKLLLLRLKFTTSTRCPHQFLKRFRISLLILAKGTSKKTSQIFYVSCVNHVIIEICITSVLKWGEAPWTPFPPPPCPCPFTSLCTYSFYANTVLKHREMLSVSKVVFFGVLSSFIFTLLMVLMLKKVVFLIKAIIHSLQEPSNFRRRKSGPT